MVAYPIQDVREMQKEQNGIGYAEHTSPAYTLDTTGGQAVAYSMHGAMVGRNDEAGPKGSGFFGENEPSYTLTASSQARHGVVTVVKSASMVRRLTPLECERLQGFPDGWTEGQTDGHRYKQLGNAVAVPVVSWIVERLVKITKEGQTNDLD
jgi:DNA (cytosine-5)-methyltransferase 1